MIALPKLRVMKKLVYLFILMNSIGVLKAQESELKGRVLDRNTNVPLPGTTVLLKESNVSVVTNKEGYFAITNPPSSVVLIVSHIGYGTAELFLTGLDKETKILKVELSPIYKQGDEIVVSASRRTEKITDAPASIQVIGQQELNQFAGSNVGELAAYVQGVEFVRTGVDGISFNARGLNNAFNNKVFQMVDGRNSMNPLSGGLMMGNNFSVNKEDIERIEILLGPQTALYGPNVHNALFNYITKDPRKYPGTSLAFSAGNQQQFSARFRQAAKLNERWNYKLTGEYATGKDFEFYDSVYAGGGPNGVFGPSVAIPERIDFNFKHLRGEAHVYYSPTPSTDIILTAGGSNNNIINTHTGGRNQFVGVTNSFLQARFKSPRFYFTVYNAWADFGDSYSIVGYTRDFWNRTHSTAITGPNAKLFPEEAEIFAKRLGNSFKESPQRFNVDGQYNYNFLKQELSVVAGLSYQEDKPRGYGINLVDSFQRIYVSQLGTVLQVEKKLPWNIRLISAARWDWHSTYENFLSPKIGLVKKLGEGNFRLSWARGYSMPSVLFQYASTGGAFFGNAEGITYIPNGTKETEVASLRKTTSLVPEQISTWELGYKGSILKKLFLDINYYNGASKNFFSPSISVGGRALYVGTRPVTHNAAVAGQFDSDGILQNARFSTIFNFGSVRVVGIDWGISYQFNKLVSLAVKHSWMHSDIGKAKPANDANKDGYVLEDERSLNGARNRGVAVLNIKNILKEKAFVNITARILGEYNFYSGNQIGTKAGAGKRGVITATNGLKYLKNFNWGPLGGFTTVDVGLGYKINTSTAVNLGITNLFNTVQREFAGSALISRLIVAELKMEFPYNR